MCLDVSCRSLLHLQGRPYFAVPAIVLVAGLHLRQASQAASTQMVCLPLAGATLSLSLSLSRDLQCCRLQCHLAQIRPLPALALYKMTRAKWQYLLLQGSKITVQELIASTQLPDESKQRLQQGMQKVGYGDNEDVGDTVRGLHEAQLEKAAALANLKPPLTVRGMQALLLLKAKQAGELILTVKGPWSSNRH